MISEVWNGTHVCTEYTKHYSTQFLGFESMFQFLTVIHTAISDNRWFIFLSIDLWRSHMSPNLRNHRQVVADRPRLLIQGRPSKYAQAMLIVVWFSGEQDFQELLWITNIIIFDAIKQSSKCHVIRSFDLRRWRAVATRYNHLTTWYMKQPVFI